jgi:hypothetical protein
MRYALAALAVLLAFPAHAQSCGPRAGLEDIMLSQHGEMRVSVALDADSNLIEVWVNPETRHWSATMTKPDGTACFVSYGYDYEAVPIGVDG